MKARFTGRCWICDSRISIDDAILKRGGSYVHADCCQKFALMTVVADRVTRRMAEDGHRLGYVGLQIPPDLHTVKAYPNSTEFYRAAWALGYLSYSDLAAMIEVGIARQRDLSE